VCVLLMVWSCQFGEIIGLRIKRSAETRDLIFDAHGLGVQRPP
jgi:hypothetical protein